MPLLVPGVPTAMFTKLAADLTLRNGIALTGVADAIKKQARINASNGGHALHTQTPASPGTGPGWITGSRTLIKSIDRSPVTREAFGWYCRVGTAQGRMPPYAGGWQGAKTSSQYGYILEITGCNNGAHYPFLYKAAEFVFEIAAHTIYSQLYGTNWARVI